MSRARALRDSPRCVWFSLVRGLRLGWLPIRCRASAPILRSEPRFHLPARSAASALLPVLTPCRGLVPSGACRVVGRSLLSGVYASDGHRSAVAHRRSPSAPNPGFHLPARSAAPALPAGCGCCPFCTHSSPSAAHLRRSRPPLCLTPPRQRYARHGGVYRCRVVYDHSHPRPR